MGWIGLERNKFEGNGSKPILKTAGRQSVAIQFPPLSVFYSYLYQVPHERLPKRLILLNWDWAVKLFWSNSSKSLVRTKKEKIS